MFQMTSFAIEKLAKVTAFQTAILLGREILYVIHGILLIPTGFGRSIELLKCAVYKLQVSFGPWQRMSGKPRISGAQLV